MRAFKRKRTEIVERDCSIPGHPQAAVGGDTPAEASVCQIRNQPDMGQSKTSEDLLRHTAQRRERSTRVWSPIRNAFGTSSTPWAKQLDVVRDQAGRHADKLDAAEASCVHLKTLESVGDSWRDTYWGPAASVRRVRFHLRRTTPKKASNQLTALTHALLIERVVRGASRRNAQHRGPTDQRPISGHFIMLSSLPRFDQVRVLFIAASAAMTRLIPITDQSAGSA